MIDQAKLKAILPIFLELESLDDEEIVDAIIGKGIDEAIAERITAFIPSAFCHITLSHNFDVTFSDSYKVNDSDDLLFYKDEPVFLLGIKLASEIYHHVPELKDVLNSIVKRSAEFNVINNALNENADIAGAKFSPMNYFGYKTLGKKRGLLSKIFS